jgi:hypothetical protein
MGYSGLLAPPYELNSKPECVGAPVFIKLNIELALDLLC